MPGTDPEFMARMLESLGGFIYVYDIEDQRNLYVSPRWGEEFGYSMDETQVSPGELLPRIIHPDDLPAVAAHHHALRCAQHDRVHLLEYRVRHRDGRYVWVSSVDRPMERDEQGKVTTIVGHAHDITSQKVTEIAEAEGRARFRAIVENLPDAVFIVGSDARIRQVNDAACEQLGYSRDELSGMRVTDIVPSAYRERVRDRLTMPFGTATTRLSTHLRRDGTEVPVETVVVGIEIDGEPAYMGVARDISDRLRLEAQLRDAQRMEAIGRLAGSVAHDFNNILAAIMGGAELLRHRADGSGGVDRIAGEIAAAARRGADLTHQLLTFGRRQPVDMRSIEVAPAIERTLAVLRRLVEPSVEIHTEMAAGEAIIADRAMFDQVIMNLTLNARDAMPHGGTLGITVAASVEQPDMVEIRVSDTGVGIDADDLPHVFEPFFTTKADGQGTGIGLATVYGIATQHQARIRVDSEPGQGTRFTILWPRAVGSRLRPDSYPAPRSQPAHGRKLTVLLVEDIEEVRRMLEHLLHTAGHRVLVADGPETARALFTRHGNEVDVMLSDVALGGADGGPELAAELQGGFPELPVILMSGHAKDTERMRQLTRAEFLQKPFTLSQLDAVIARLIR